MSIAQFEVRLKDNLYKLWNRMSSGSYFPGPVRAVEIPKKGGTRVLGIPSVVDRVAQTVAVMALEPDVEKVFHDDSYGYRPGRSPLDAVRRAGSGVQEGLGRRFGRQSLLGCFVTLLFSLIVMVKTVLPGWLGAGYAGLFGVRCAGGRLAVRRA